MSDVEMMDKESQKVYLLNVISCHVKRARPIEFETPWEISNETTTTFMNLQMLMSSHDQLLSADTSPGTDTTVHSTMR